MQESSDFKGMIIKIINILSIWICGADNFSVGSCEYIGRVVYK